MVIKIKFLGLWLALILAALLPACSLYRPDLRQGDYITQEELDKLKTGQTKHEVQDIMGSPAMQPFFKLDQWNYTYAYLDGNHRDQPLKFRTISLYFEHGKLESYASRYWHPSHLPKTR